MKVLLGLIALFGVVGVLMYQFGGVSGSILSSSVTAPGRRSSQA